MVILAEPGGSTPTEKTPEELLNLGSTARNNFQMGTPLPPKKPAAPAGPKTGTGITSLNFDTPRTDGDELIGGWQAALHPEEYETLPSPVGDSPNSIFQTGSTMIDAKKAPKGATALSIVQGVSPESSPVRKLRLWKGASDERTKLAKTPAAKVQPVYKSPPEEEPEINPVTGDPMPRLKTDGDWAVDALKQEVDKEATAELQKAADKEAKQARAPRSRELSEERYNNLSPLKRAAIDFNTMLVQTREKDLTAEYEAEGPDPEYQAAVKRIFGEGNGSDIVAPETLALLNKLEFKAPESGLGSDFDDFLNLKAGFKGQDLRTLDDGTKSNIYARLRNLPGTERETDGLTQGMKNLQSALAGGTQMLADMRSTMTRAVGQEATVFGGTANDLQVPVGFGEGEADSYFKQAFDALVDKGNADQREEILGRLNAYLEPNGLVESFSKFAAIKADNADRYKVPLLDIDGIDVATPDEFREMLGLTKKAGE